MISCTYIYVQNCVRKMNPLRQLNTESCLTVAMRSMWKINFPFSRNVVTHFSLSHKKSTHTHFSRWLLSGMVFRCHCVNIKVANDKLKIDRMIEIGWIKSEHLQHGKCLFCELYKQIQCEMCERFLSNYKMKKEKIS